MDFKQVFADEVRRLARKEVRAASESLYETIATLRKQIAEQKKQIVELAKSCVLKEEKKSPVDDIPMPNDGKSLRLNAAGIVRLRTKLGLTQGDFARVLGVAMHTVSVWEQGRRVPRAAHKAKICALRKIGKRELKKLLAESPEVTEVADGADA